VVSFAAEPGPTCLTAGEAGDGELMEADLPGLTEQWWKVAVTPGTYRVEDVTTDVPGVPGVWLYPVCAGTPFFGPIAPGGFFPHDEVIGYTGFLYLRLTSGTS